MKSITLTIIALIILQSNSQAQITDSALIKKLSINGFCLCNTTLSDLKNSNPDLKKTEVEEMDLAKNCYGQDSRFIAGSGYSTEKYSGLVFQKDQESDYISKIRLTKTFKGKLPDGNFINLDKLDLKGLLKIYPQLKDKWGSRDCSGYWHFSNDTISFYVKIDKSKKPQFPIDEAYYMDKPVEAVDLITSCYGIQKNDTDNHVQVVQEESADPIFFIDSVKVKRAELGEHNPSDIASVTIYKDTNATKRLPKAKNGLIYIETKSFARHRYWNYFKSKSTDYARLVPSIEEELKVQYILNKNVLDKNFEGDLSAINDKIFKDITIITKEQLVKDYNITDKDFGVLINSDVPTNMHKGRGEF